MTLPENVRVACQDPDCLARYVTSADAFRQRVNRCPVCHGSKARELPRESA